ncbi:unnamed protein product [Rhizophagus irregularis]|nr:unnamed protein product [Rhizophagus irregularis]
MTSKDESSIPEISAGAPAKILLLIIPVQKPVRRAQEHSLDSAEESILTTPNIYDETAKWGEIYYYDDETADWGTPYKDRGDKL